MQKSGSYEFMKESVNPSKDTYRVEWEEPRKKLVEDTGRNYEVNGKKLMDKSGSEWDGIYGRNWEWNEKKLNSQFQPLISALLWPLCQN